MIQVVFALAMLASVGANVLLAGSAPPAPGRGDGLSQAAVGQQQLRGSTVRVAEQVDLILEEFTRNEIGGEDVQLLASIRGVLGQLTEADMLRVVSLLQEARELPDAGVQRGRLLEAFGTQKGVGLKLRQILLEYQRQQELAGMAARLEELAVRQHLAMRDGVSLAGAAAGRRRDWLSENQRIALQLAVSEQQTLRDEVSAVLDKLGAWTRGEDNDAAIRAADVLSRPETTRLARVADEALVDLGAGRLLSATGRQREARGLLREVAHALMPPADLAEALQEAVREVELLIARQEAVRNTTRQLDERSPGVAASLESQAMLVDDGDVVRGQVVRLDGAAGEQLAGAVGRMQEARGVMEAESPPMRARRLTAATQQDLALARLTTARRLLLQRIDTLEKQREAMADPRSNLERVRQDVAELLERERELKDQAAAVAQDPGQLRPMAPRQGDLGDRTQDAAARAELDSAEAATELSSAVTQMRQAQRSLGEGRNNAGAQQAAIDALAQALEALDRKLAQLEAMEQELAELEELLQRLMALIEAQQGLNAETARLARKAPARPSTRLGEEQTGLSAATRELEGRLPASVPQAATYLNDAGTQMILAANELGLEHPAEARPPQDEALANLQRARRELEERIAQLQNELGQPAQDASLEQLAQMIKEAQQDVNDAMSTDALKQMSDALQKAGRRVQPATSGRMGRVPRMVRDPLQQAEQALTEGAAAAAGGDQAGSQGEAGRAQEALAAAAAAIDLAMAGMGQQPGAGEGQGGQGTNPGPGQGRGRGRQPGAQSGRGTGDAGNFFGAGGADGPRRGTTGTSRFIGLPARERAALLQSQGETYPQEYAPMIEQYLKNLSDQTGEVPK